MNDATQSNEGKQIEGQHATRTNGWCFCPECNEARQDMRRYEPDNNDAYEQANYGEAAYYEPDFENGEG